MLNVAKLMLVILMKLMNHEAYRESHCIILG